MTTPETPQDPESPAAIGERIVLLRLLAMLRRTGDILRWDLADPYLRRHIIEHANRAGELVRFLADGEFLVHADPVAVASVIPPFRDAYDPWVKETLDVYCASIGWHQHVGGSARRQILALDALRLGHIELAYRMQRGPSGRLLPWRCLWSTATNVSSSSGATMTGHAGRVTALTVLRDSIRTLAVTGSEDRTARVWDLAAGTARHVLLHSAPVTATAAASGPDGGATVLTAADHLAQWDAYSGNLLRTVPLAHSVHAIAVAPDSTHAVLASRGPAYLVDLRSGAHPGARPIPVAGTGVRHAAVGWEGPARFAVTVSADDRVTAFTLPDGRLLHQGVLRHRDELTAFTVADIDGQALVLTGHRSGTCVVVHAYSGTVLYTLRDPNIPEDTQPRSRVSSLAVHRGARGWLAVSGHHDGTLRTWDLSTGQLLRAFRPHAAAITAIDTRNVHHRGRTTPVLLTSSEDDTARCWDATTGALRDVLAGHTSGLTAGRLTEVNGRPVAVTVSKDRTVRTWDTTREVPPHDPGGHPHWVRSLALHRIDGTLRAITACRDEQVRILDTISGEIVHRLEAPQHLPVHAAVPVDSRGETLVAAAGVKGTLFLWNLATPELRHTVSLEPATITALAATEDGTGDVTVIAGRGDGGLTVWRPASARPLRTLLPGRRRSPGVAALAVTNLGAERVVVAGRFDGYLRVHTLTDGALIHVRPHATPVRAVAAGRGADGPCTAAGLADGEIHLRGLQDGAITHVLHGHSEAVRALAFSRIDGADVLVSGSADGTVRVWDTADGSQLHRIDLPDIVQTVAHQDGLLAIGYGREVSVFVPALRPTLPESRSL